MKDITIRELLEQVNVKLKENIEKPVIKKGSNTWRDSYDTSNGMREVSMSDLERMVNEIVDETCSGEEWAKHIYWRTNKFVLTLDGTWLHINAKRKKTSIRTWNNTDALVIWKIELDDFNVEKGWLDRTLSSFAEENRLSKLEEERRSEKQYNDFIKSMDDAGISPEQFYELKEKYTQMDYNNRYDFDKRYRGI